MGNKKPLLEMRDLSSVEYSSVHEHHTQTHTWEFSPSGVETPGVFHLTYS